MPTLAAAPKRPLPPAAAVVDAEALSSSGFGLLGLDVPEDLSDDSDNPYAAFAAAEYSTKVDELQQDEDLIY